MIWAFLTISLSSACLNITSNFMTGIILEFIMSCRTFPHPTDGSWSISPMNITFIFSGTALSIALRSNISIIELSSTIKTSSSSGFSSFLLKHNFLSSFVVLHFKHLMYRFGVFLCCFFHPFLMLYLLEQHKRL